MSCCKGKDGCCGAPIVTLYCKANPDYHIAVRDSVGTGVCIVSADNTDDSLLWVRDDKMAKQFLLEGAFALVHKETRLAIRVAPEEGKQVLLAAYNPQKLDKTVLWYESKDKGGGWKTIYNDPKDPSMVLHALRCMKCDQLEPCPEGEARIKENTLVVILKDHTDGPPGLGASQLWKMGPAS